MCLIKGTFVGKRNFDIIKMHSTTIEIEEKLLSLVDVASVTMLSRYSLSEMFGLYM